MNSSKFSKFRIKRKRQKFTRKRSTYFPKYYIWDEAGRMEWGTDGVKKGGKLE